MCSRWCNNPREIKSFKVIDSYKARCNQNTLGINREIYVKKDNYWICLCVWAGYKLLLLLLFVSNAEHVIFEYFRTLYNTRLPINQSARHFSKSFIPHMTQPVSIHNQIDYNQLYHPFTWYITAHTHTGIHNLTVTAGIRIRIYFWHWVSAINDVSTRCGQFQLHNLEPWLHLRIQTLDKYREKESFKYLRMYVYKYVCPMTMCRFFYHTVALSDTVTSTFDDKSYRG